MTASRIVSVGTETPSTSYTQEQILEFLGVTDRRTRSLFLNGGIDRRCMTIPPEARSFPTRGESQKQLLTKHRDQGVVIGSGALQKSLAKIGAEARDVQYLCCVTTTGLLTPGFSALLCQAMGMRVDCGRLDIVGMGCNAGLNGLNAVTGWSQTHRGQLAAMVCVEVCSAAYVVDDKMETAVVNSLFGDGSAAILVAAGEYPHQGPEIVKFASYLIPGTLDAMAFNWDEHHGKFSFSLARDVPYVVGAHVEHVIRLLLEGTRLRRSDIAHWIVHSGGRKVIDSIAVNLGLAGHDLRHTSSVLRDYGNLSSGSFLFSFERLLEEDTINAGDYGVMLTMGPGSTLEAALLQW